MASESFNLSHCTPDDVESMVSVYLRAWENDYVNSFTFPKTAIPPAEKHQWLRERFLKTFQKPEIRNFKIVDASTGRMVAWARWGFPYEEKVQEGNEKEEEREFDPKEWPRGANLELCEEKFGTLHRKKKTYCNKADTYNVDLICTDPAFQRRGLASKLLRHGTDLADAQGRQTYIEATSDGHPVYLKQGFKDIDVITLDFSKWGGKEPGITRIMMRDPRPVA